MAEYKKENVNDIFRKIKGLNEMSDKSKSEDKEKNKTIITKIIKGINGDEIEDISDRKDFMTFVKEAIGMTRLEVKFKKLDERAAIPTYAHDGDVGMDFTAIAVEYNEDMDCYIYHTGLAFETDKHYGIFMFARSSNRKTDAYLCNHVGIADSAIYRGEILFCFKNRTSLKLNALEARINSFFNAIEDGKTVEDATKDSLKEYNEYMLNPMDFAPYDVGDRIGQMVVLPYPNVKLIERTQLSDTERGDNGFGSTDLVK